MKIRVMWVGVAIGFSVLFYFNAYLCDDAFFSFRSADNLVRGYGLRFNPDERVQVYTNPLHTLAFAGVYGLSHDRSSVPNPDRVYFSAMGLSWLVSLFALLWIVRRIGAASGVAPLLALLASSHAFVTFTSSGLENPWTNLFVALFYGTWLWREPQTPRDFWLLLLWASLAVVNRLDTALLFLPACAYLGVRGFAVHGSRLAPGVLLASLPMLAWFGFALVYYGFLFPNSYYAKIGLAVDRGILDAMGSAYFRVALRQDPITLATIASGVAVSAFDRRDRWIGLSILLYVGYIHRVGGDFIGQRFLAAPFLMAALVLLRRALDWKGWSGRWAAGVTAALVAYSALVPHSPLRAFHDGPAEGDVEYYFAASSLARWRPGRAFPFEPYLNVDSAEACRRLHADRPRVSIRGGGFASYCRGPLHHSIVPAGIANPLLARLPVRVEVPFLPGHVFKPIPIGYAESFTFGCNAIEDEGLAAYFDELRVVTTGPLFSARRWRAIWRLNFTPARRYSDAYLGVRARASIAPPLR